jgi:hypothetical protein
MMVLSVLSETPHCECNDSQDTVARLETVLLSIERETQLQEVKGFMKSTGEDQELMRNMEKVKKR